MAQHEQIFNILSKGRFIASNSLDSEIKNIYDDLEDNFDTYYDYFLKIGFILERGDGYFYFSRKEAKADSQRKLESLLKWLDYVEFLKTFQHSFSPGFIFSSADIIQQIKSDVELKEKAENLFKDKNAAETVEKVVKELEDMGFVEISDEYLKTYKVTNAFNYIDELLECININQEEENETT
jgi:poly(A) polymerase Pap1